MLLSSRTSKLGTPSQARAGRFVRAISACVIGGSSVVTPALWLGLGTSVVACKGDPEENFRLWSNNEAGWDAMGKYVADRGNDVKLRARALEVLIDEGGQPSQAMRLAEHAPDKVELLLALQPALEKLLVNPNEKKQDHGKRVLMDMIGVLPDDKKAVIRKLIAKWAFEGLTPDMPTEKVVDKLGKRLRPEEIEVLGDEGVYGAEIMLSKGIARDGVIGVLLGMKTPAANHALIAGMRRYHKIKNVKIADTELGAVQKTDSVEGFLYFVELYLRLQPSSHPDDKAASSMAIAAATQWADAPESAAKIKAGWAQVKPVMEGLVVSKNCDDRWWAGSLLTKYDGVDGVKAVLSKFPDDKNYGLEEFAQNDVKKMMTDWCTQDVKPLGVEKIRPLFEASLQNQGRLIERIIGLRCLVALGDDPSLGVLKAYAAKKGKERDQVPTNAIIVPHTNDAVSVADLAQAGAEIIEFCRATDKLAAEGKIDAPTAKWRKFYAQYSFERRGKELEKNSIERAEEKVQRDKDKAQKAGADKGAPAKK